MTEPKQWAIEQHIKKNPKCEWLCTHTKLENLGEQPEDRPITEPTIDTLYQKITDICFENGGATKPMVDKLYKLISDQVAKAIEGALDQVGVFVLGGTVRLNDIYGNDYRNNYGYNETQVRDAANWIQDRQRVKLETLRATLNGVKK